MNVFTDKSFFHTSLMVSPIEPHNIFNKGTDTDTFCLNIFHMENNRGEPKQAQLAYFATEETPFPGTFCLHDN